MRIHIKLALSSIRKNRKLYYPYILTCICMIMMMYITAALANNPGVRAARGGTTASVMLLLGVYVIGFFSVLFLAYSNTFIIKRRNKEFGLYNVLGMNKANIIKILLAEYIVTSAISIVIGLFLGIVLYKFADLAFMNIIGEQINYDLSIDWISARNTALIFALIFVILLSVTIIRILKTDTLELVKAESLGELPPKANYLPAVIGVVMLVVAYYIAVATENPVTAVTLFFLAVLLVIAATYLLFISGSVALCRFLKNKKSYYYRKNHFISVSGMFFRMKHNGAGLASICILSTMILVMLFSTISLYVGAEDTLRSKYPRELTYSFRFKDGVSFENANTDEYEEIIEKQFEKAGVTWGNVLKYKDSIVVGEYDKNSGCFNYLSNAVYDFTTNMCEIIFMTPEDFATLGGERLEVEPGNAYVYTKLKDYRQKEFTIEDISFNIKGRLDKLPELMDATPNLVTTVVVIINSYEEITSLDSLSEENKRQAVNKIWNYYVDVNADEDTIADLYNEIPYSLEHCTEEDILSVSYDCRSLESADFYSTYGSFFFLGVVLSVVFSFACVLIIYYKQVTEGYMDQSRFEIMKKVGMTDKDIRASINNQILTVFFAPLVLAGIHIAFAFPMVWRVLQLFEFHNLKLFIMVTVITYICYAVIYSVVYKITAHAYYRIINEN